MVLLKKRGHRLFVVVMFCIASILENKDKEDRNVEAMNLSHRSECIVVYAWNSSIHIALVTSSFHVNY